MMDLKKNINLKKEKKTSELDKSSKYGLNGEIKKNSNSKNHGGLLLVAERVA